MLQELEDSEAAHSTAIAQCKLGLAEAILAERPRWRRQQDAAEAEQLLRGALLLFQQTHMEPSLIADLNVTQPTALTVTIRIGCCATWMLSGGVHAFGAENMHSCINDLWVCVLVLQGALAVSLRVQYRFEEAVQVSLHDVPVFTCKK
jgi:hypothetical protein